MAGDGFCAIPERAMGDKRLNASHHRLLLAIAFHDRFSEDRGSAGCYASQNTLERETGIHRTEIGQVAKDLARWGYISVSPHKKDRRLRVYRMMYKGDHTVVGGITNDLPATDPALSEKVGEVSNDPAIVGGRPLQVAEPSSSSEAKYITRSVIDSGNQQRDLAEARQSNGSARLQWGEVVDRMRRLFPMLKDEAVSAILMKSDTAYAHLERAAITDDRFREIVRSIDRDSVGVQNT